MNKDSIKTMFSSATDDWATPQDFFDKLDAEFNFTLDPCASESNHKCAKFYTKEQDGLLQNWGGGARILQPSVWQGDCKVGGEVLEVRTCRNAYSGEDGHEMVPRIHLRESGNPFYQGSPEVREPGKLGAVPVNGSCF